MTKIHYIADDKISLAAKGLMVILSMLPFNADKSSDAIIDYCDDTREQVESAYRELVSYEYITVNNDLIQLNTVRLI